MPCTRRSSVYSFTSSVSSTSSEDTATVHGQQHQHLLPSRCPQLSSSGSSCSSSSDLDDDNDDDHHLDAVYNRHSHSRSRHKANTLSPPQPEATGASKAVGRPQQRGKRPANILLRVLQRERTGFLSSHAAVRSNQQRLAAVPEGLSFCLQDIVPYCYLTGHVFMGLTVCGQFLLSYKVQVIETGDFNQFSIGSYKYELFFWIYRPHQLLRKYYSRTLFDDHGADNEVTVTMCQWLDHPHTLIVHGSLRYDTEYSYVSVLAVPRLSCLDCRRLRDVYCCPTTSSAASQTPGTGTGFSRSDSRSAAVLCISCNLSVHTKYTRAESDPPFEPHINLNCPGRLILFTNGLIHALNVNLQLQQGRQMAMAQSRSTTGADVRPVRRKDENAAESEEDLVQAVDVVQPQPQPHSLAQTTTVTTQRPEDIVAQIIADFDEFDAPQTSPTCLPATPMVSAAAASSEPPLSQLQQQPKPLMTTKYFEELVLNSLPSPLLAPRSSELLRRQPHGNSRRWIARLASETSSSAHQHTASATVTSATVSQPTATAAASRAYEFSDDPPERYEKISSFRKRRLADKKYEFSEDNSENIIPFAKLRMRRQTLHMLGGDSTSSAAIAAAAGSQSPAATVSGGDALSQQPGPAAPPPPPPPHTHRASPSHGFRSPCGSPVGGTRFMSIMSPPMSVVSAMRGGGGMASPNHAAQSTGASAGAVDRIGRSPTYNSKPFGSSPSRYLIARGGANDAATTIYTPLLLSPRSDGDFEVYRGVATAMGIAGLPLAEVKPSNIFTSAASLVADAAEPAKLPSTTVQLAADSVREVAADDEASAERTAAAAADDDCAAQAQTDAAAPVCAKRLVRRYMTSCAAAGYQEEADDNNDDDDRLSVLTSEEDDCISPGYHTSLPVEVHGACYAPMELVSAGTMQRRRQMHAANGAAAAAMSGAGRCGGGDRRQLAAAVLIEQHTFDLETLTYHIANRLCRTHGKQYGSFYDWACEPIHICPLSEVLCSLLLVNFTARDATQPGADPCLNCANGDRLDCAFHRRHFECRSLFTWNVQSGGWTIVDYGELTELPTHSQRQRRRHDTNHAGVGGSGESSSSSSRSGNSSSSNESASAGISDATTTAAAAPDLATRARRLAAELRATLLPSPAQARASTGGAQETAAAAAGGLLGAGGAAVKQRLRRRVRQATIASRVAAEGSSWAMAGLHTLDSCPERSKEVLRDQYNAIEFVRGAADAVLGGGMDGRLAAPTASYLAGLLSSSSDNSDWE